MRMLVSQGVRTSIIRLPPVVHGESERNGFVPSLIKTARKKGESAYAGDGLNRRPAVHKLDAAHLFRLALGSGPVGAAYRSAGRRAIIIRRWIAHLVSSQSLQT
jgi:nucleoside-diphosphate-sugar epimerase